jgi:hypothetical protein
MQIKGLDGMTEQDLVRELQSGGRFVIYSFAVSIVILTFKQPTSIYFLRGHENATVQGLPWTMISFFCGWWGFPFGPIYTIWSIVENLGGGKDVTQEVVAALGVSRSSAPTPPRWVPN